MRTTENHILSVIIPTKNRPYLLSCALRSVAQQNYPSFEICVADNNDNRTISSQVETIVTEFKNEFPHLIWIYIHSNKSFASGTRNDGLKATTGKYVIFLDDDDEFLEGSIQQRVEEMSSDPELALLYCAAYSKIFPYPFKMYRYYHYSRELHKDKLLMMSCSSIMINRKIFADHNLYFDELQSRMDDYDLCRRVIQLDLKVKSIPSPLVLIHLHPDTRISSHKLINYDFKDVLIKRWGNSALDVVYDYAEGVYIWRKCFGIEQQGYKEIKKALKITFNRTLSRSFRLKYLLVSINPQLFLTFYHFAIIVSQHYKNKKAIIADSKIS